MQKSRSEEEGSAAFIVKETKSPATTLEKQKEEPEDKTDEKEDREGAQSTDTLDADVTCDVTIVWQPRGNDVEDARSSTRSDTSSSSSRFDWPEEEEQFERQKNRRKSDTEEHWTWTERDT